MSTDVYIDELDDNGEYVECHGRLGYLSVFINQKYGLMTALENINLIFPKLTSLVIEEMITQFERFHVWVKNLSSEEKEEAVMMGLYNDYASPEEFRRILEKFPLNSKWRIRVD